MSVCIFLQSSSTGDVCVHSAANFKLEQVVTRGAFGAGWAIRQAEGACWHWGDVQAWGACRTNAGVLLLCRENQDGAASEQGTRGVGQRDEMWAGVAGDTQGPCQYVRDL